MVDISIKCVYSKSEILQHNLEVFQIIPSDHKYDRLRQFVDKYGTITTSKQVPAYLKNRYGIGQTDMTISRGPDAPERKKLFDDSNLSQSEKFVGKFRELISKISEKNRDAIMTSINELKIPAECGQQVCTCLYETAIDLAYLQHIYIDVIDIIRGKYPQLYKYLIEHVTKQSFNVVDFTDRQSKRLAVGTLQLVGRIHQHDATSIDSHQILSIINAVIERVDKEHEYIDLICELLHYMTQTEIAQIKDKLIVIKTNASYEKRYRFKLQDIVDH